MKKKSKAFWAALAFLILCLCVAANWVYHVARKPSEVVGLVDTHFYKTPKDTWSAYSRTFSEFSTPVITPELLAALAQNETRGNSLARTYWHWNFSATNPFDFYGPASSAVGLLQMTDGTFDVARHYCVVKGEVFYEGESTGCSEGRLRSRLLPAHSIEMTSAYLHVNVTKTLRKFHVRKATKAQKHDLAAVIHLCGSKRGEAFVLHKFRFQKGERCGAFDEKRYVTNVRRLEQTFVTLHKKELKGVKFASQH